MGNAVPVMMGFNESPAGAAQTGAGVGVSQQEEDGIRHVLCSIRHHQVPPRLCLNIADCHRAGNNRRAARHGFQDLVLNSHTLGDRSDGKRGMAQIRPDIFDAARDENS